MRGTVTGLRGPHSIGDLLPAVYSEDDFAQRFTGALDEVLAPVLSTLDCMDAYFAPALAPADFVDLLARWVALPLGDGWSLERRRRLVAAAVALHRRRGTRGGLADLVALVTGGEVEIIESGGCVASADPDAPLPGSGRPWLHVRVRVADPASVNADRLDDLIAANKPAHLPHSFDVLPTDVLPNGALSISGPLIEAPSRDPSAQENA
jgi:phage tail-like protein